jgi:hypothetical protein
MSYADFSNVLARLNYKILDLQPFSPVQPGSEFDAFCILAMQTFMISFWHTPCIQHELFRRLHNCLIDSIKTLVENGTGNDEIILWSLFVGACSIFRTFDDPWFQATTLRLARQLGLKSWDDTLLFLNKFPWIPFFHEKMARKLWAALPTWDKDIL